MTDAPHELFRKLAGGDRRSTGNVDEVVAAVRKTPALFGALFEGMLAGDPVVRMRSADAAEKLTAGNSGLLAPYKRRLLREVAASPQQEVRWHVAQMIPRLTLTKAESAAAAETLISHLGDKSAIVKTFSMQALAPATTMPCSSSGCSRPWTRWQPRARGDSGRSTSKAPPRSVACRWRACAGPHSPGGAGLGLSNRPLRDQKRIALRLFDEPQTEDRPGVLILSEILLSRLTAADLPSFALLFERGRVADWNLCDWFCVKVLGRMIERADDTAGVAKAISAWRTAGTLWQRRASCVAFVNLAKGGERLVPGLPDMIVENCAALVRDPARFAQTGGGWVMRELSLHDAALASRFAAGHVAELSPEAMKYITGKMPAAEQRRLRAMHAQSRAQRQLRIRKDVRQ